MHRDYLVTQNGRQNVIVIDDENTEFIAEMEAVLYDPQVHVISPFATTEEAAAAKFMELQASYEAAITADISYLGAAFQADEYSQQVLVKSLSGGALYAPDFWQDKDNVMHTVTFAELQGLSGAMLARGKVAYINLQTKKAAVRSATTIQQVEAVTWS